MVKTVVEDELVALKRVDHCTTQDVDFGSIALHFPGTKRVNG